MKTDIKVVRESIVRIQYDDTSYIQAEVEKLMDAGYDLVEDCEDVSKEYQHLAVYSLIESIED